jgi:glyoxylase-like metal-dependent hydrolase (beta-lactamase superfamily II)
MAKVVAQLGLLICMSAALIACDASSVATVPATLGEPVSIEAMTKSVGNGPLVFEKHLVATWSVPLSGLLNLEHPKAVAAGITDRDEPIDIYSYSIRHPNQGTFLIDSGISERFRLPAENDDLSAIVKMGMNTQALVLRKSTSELSESLGGVNGVFLTHIHIDHIMGLTDLPAATPVYIGPGDARLSGALNLFTQGTTDRLLGVQGQLREWQYGQAQALDVFGDGSFYAIHSPGHTPGSTAYLAMTTNGPQLMIGDATHTRWGWENGVEPGTFSADIPQSAQSLAMLKDLGNRVPVIEVHPGHQSLTEPGVLVDEQH